MAQSRFRFDQAPTHVMRDEQLLALVRQTQTNEPVLLPLMADEESDSVPTSLYRAVEVQRIEQEWRPAPITPPTAPPAAAPETRVAPAAVPSGAWMFAATVGRFLLLLLVTGGLAYLTWQAPARFGLGFGLAATTAATSPARVVAPAAAATSKAR